MLTRDILLANLVRAARLRLFHCSIHDVDRTGPATCELCILESRAAADGRAVRFRSIAEIMAV